MKRSAVAVWNGTGKEGSGHLTTDSQTLAKTQYSFTSRFEEGTGTNPEELVAAAHAGCFAMKLSFNLSGAGFRPDELEVKCTLTFENGSIISSELDLAARVADVSEGKFAELVEDAEKNCPISKLLSTKISVVYTLN